MLLRLFGVISLAVGTVVCLLCGAFESYMWLWLLPLVALGSLIVLLAGGFLYLVILANRVDLDKEQDGDDAHYRKVVELYLESVLPVLRVHTKVSGMEKVPSDGRFLLVCNHCNNIDPILLLDCFAGRQVAFISKRENRDLFLVGPVMHKLQCQLINRENDREALKTILKCIQLLKEDKASIGVFPEGWVFEDRKLHRFRPGVFKIAQKAKVPIVVCTLRNTATAVHDLLRYKPTNAELHVVEVVYPEQYQGETTVDLAERIYQMMAQDLGPENISRDET